MENSEQKVKIRKATYEDLEPICDIYTEAFNGKTNPSNRQWWNILDNPNISCTNCKISTSNADTSTSG